MIFNKLNHILYLFFYSKKLMQFNSSFEKKIKTKNFFFIFSNFIIIAQNIKFYNYIHMYKTFLLKNNRINSLKIDNNLILSNFNLLKKKRVFFSKIKIFSNLFYFSDFSKKIVCKNLTHSFLFKYNFFFMLFFFDFKKFYNFSKNFININKHPFRVNIKVKFSSPFKSNSPLIYRCKNNNYGLFENFLSQNKYIVFYFHFNLCNNTKIKPKKKINFNINYFLNYVIFINDFCFINNSKKNVNLLSNKIFKNYFNFFDFNSNMSVVIKKKQKLAKIKNYNNYYPILLSNKLIYKNFFSNYKTNYEIDFVAFTNKFVVSFLEKNFKKFIYIKYLNNFYYPLNNNYLSIILKDYKNYQPAFWKNFLVVDFISLIWYSFLLKDLNMISEWISIFMETLNFKNHKKFLTFFLNFVNKYSDVFINILNIKGFFFDIRGKVGVTGSSKKRHFFFKFGSLNKSSKKSKINFNQSLVRTYSGVLGLTYIINY